MIALRLTLFGTLLVWLASGQMENVPFMWSALVFGSLSLSIGKRSSAALIGTSVLAICGITLLYAYGRSGSTPSVTLLIVHSHDAYLLLFAYFFIPMIFLSSLINVYDVAPSKRSSKPSGIIRSILVQTAHRRAALVRRAKEVFETLELRGLDVRHPLGRFRHANLWVPVLVSTAFVEALESSAYEQQMGINLALYEGLFRPKRSYWFGPFLLDSLNLLLLSVMGLHVFAAFG
jgi:hypothetical protein